MHTPNKLLKILFSYLRSMFLSYNGASSSQKMLPGGTTQGAYFGGIIFLVKFIITDDLKWQKNCGGSGLK